MTKKNASSAAAEVEATGPLAGLRVVEMGQLLAGPFCGQMLGDMGAEVIKIEDPKKGDPLRQWGRVSSEGDSLWWSIVGRNKKSVGINLRTESGQSLAKRIIASADIVIENFRPGTLERWGLSYDELSKENPGLIMARVSGFGQTGPYSSRAGYGAIGEAMGGLRYVVGDPSTPPSRVGISIGDTLAALFATIGVLSALHRRSIDGRGQVVDSAIYEAVLGIMESILPEWVVEGHQRERSGSVLPNIAPSNVYPTRDGAWMLIAANQDTVFARLAQAMGQPELATDERFVDHANRGARQEELDGLVAEFTSTYDAEDLEALMHENGVPVGKIFRPKDMLVDPHFAARGSIVTVPHRTHGEVPMQNVFPRLSRSEGNIRWAGPALGQHTDEVLEGAGLTDEEIAQLRAEEIV